MPLTNPLTSLAGVVRKSGNPYHDETGRFTSKDKALDVSRMKKMGGQGGSNPGGVYEDQEGIRHYVKFPQRNPDQAKAERLADSVYSALGIPVKESRLAHQHGEVGLAGKMLEGSHELSPEEVHKSPDVKKGYVADAYLANWDVFGMTYDNILRHEGKDYRIDNGGTLFFRAQGEPKNFSADRVDELQSLVAPGKKGYHAFGDLSPEAVKEQASQLVSTLTDGKIRQLIAEAGFEGDQAREYEKTLIGRRNVIEKLYGVKKSDPRYVDVLRSAKRRKLHGAQKVPMDVAAIDAALTAANS